MLTLKEETNCICSFDVSYYPCCYPTLNKTLGEGKRNLKSGTLPYLARPHCSSPPSSVRDAGRRSPKRPYTSRSVGIFERQASLYMACFTKSCRDRNPFPGQIEFTPAYRGFPLCTLVSSAKYQRETKSAVMHYLNRGREKLILR